MHFAGKYRRGSQVQERALLELVSVSQNTNKNLVVQGRTQLEQSNHIGLVSRLHADTFIPEVY